MLNLGLWQFTKISECEGFELIVERPMLGPTKLSLTLIVGLPWPIIFLLYAVTINKEKMVSSPCLGREIQCIACPLNLLIAAGFLGFVCVPLWGLAYFDWLTKLYDLVLVS